MIHITDGNNKMKNTGNISLPPIISCGANSHICKDYCYAKKFYRMYPACKKAWDDNFEELKTDRFNYFQSVRRYLLKKQPQYFRWHTSGDIIDQDYFNQMNRIANDYSLINFLVFTKQYHLNFYGKVKNLSVVISAWPGLELPKLNLPIAFIDFDSEDRTRRTLFDSKDKKKYNQNQIRCPENCVSCRACWFLKENENVLVSVKQG